MHRLSDALTAQQRFISGAAHQLRSAMAGLTSQTERALLAERYRDHQARARATAGLGAARDAARESASDIGPGRAGQRADREFVTIDLSRSCSRHAWSGYPKRSRKTSISASPASPIHADRGR